jgi:hypothetical protein
MLGGVEANEEQIPGGVGEGNSDRRARVRLEPRLVTFHPRQRVPFEPDPYLPPAHHVSLITRIISGVKECRKWIWDLFLIHALSPLGVGVPVSYCFGHLSPRYCFECF